MTNRTMIAFAPTILESNNLFALPLLDHFTSNLGAGHSGVPVSELFGLGVHQHIVESELFACFTLEQIDIDRVSFGDTILSAASSDDCVCHGLREKSGKYPRRREFDK